MGKSLVSNPPYNMKWNTPLFAQIQPRFYYGVPPESNANFAFVLSGLDMIDDKAAFILPNGVLSSGDADEKAIKRALIEQNVIDAIIILPDKMFESTSIGTCIVLFNKNKKTRTIEMIDMRSCYKEEVRDQNGQFGGSSHENRTYHKTVKVITDEEMNRAIKAISERLDEPGFSKSVGVEEIKKQDFVLTPSRYIDFETKEDRHRPFEEIAADYNRLVRAQNAIKITVNESLAKTLGLYDTIYLMQNAPDLSDSFAIVGCKMEKEQFVTLSKNAAEFKIENKSKERIPEMILLFVNMWKQHIMYLNNEENIILAEFRDALLNDLMSGKIDVSEGDKE